MKKAMIFIACLIFSAAAYAQTGSSAIAKNSIEKEILALNEAYRHALIKDDLKALEKMYTDDFVYIGSDGIKLHRQQMLDPVKYGLMHHQNIQFKDLKVSAISDNTAVVTGTWGSTANWRAGNNATPMAGNHAFTFIYHNKNGQWQMKAARFSPSQK